MGKLTVYFTGNHKADFEQDKVAFAKDGIVFDFLPVERPDNEKAYYDLVKEGRALVNWNNVCFVKEKPEETTPTGSGATKPGEDLW